MDGDRKLMSEFGKMPTGVEIHGGTIRISFTWNGKRRREPLVVPKVNKNSIAYASNKRAAIVAEIREGRFSYKAHFPNSEHAKDEVSLRSERTVGEGIAIFLKVAEGKKATSTFVNYRRKSKRVLEKWKGTRIADITRSDLELFQVELMEAHGLNPKTVNDIFTIIRGVWADAFADEVIGANPLDRIRNLERDDVDAADPFNRDEISRIEKAATRDQDKNMFLFDMWAGLSLSELAAVAWEDVDTERWTIKIRRARVESEYKVPKERSRVRTVELIEPAIIYLKAQMQFTKMLPAVDIGIKQRDNTTSKTESLRFVFFNDLPTGVQSWHAASMLRRFGEILRKAGVRHRGPNQCRHTFASQCLSHYVPLEWLARQMGHSDTAMIKKHYGRWIPNEAPSMAAQVSQMLGFDAAITGHKEAVLAPDLPHAIGESSNDGL